mgnify:CR=1 FL=1
MDDNEIKHARRDYTAWLHEQNFTEDFVKAVSRNGADQVSFPPEVEAVGVGPSKIAGMGIIAKRNIKAGEWLAPARVGPMRTPAGSGTNHAPNANAKAVKATGGDLYMVASRDIPAGDEVTVNYRQVGMVNGWGRVS